MYIALRGFVCEIWSCGVEGIKIVVSRNGHMLSMCVKHVSERIHSRTPFGARF